MADALREVSSLKFQVSSTGLVREARLFTWWLCHSDARQAFDLPSANLSSSGSMTLAKFFPGHRPPSLERVLGKSETCRASAWQSHLAAILLVGTRQSNAKSIAAMSDFVRVVQSYYNFAPCVPHFQIPNSIGDLTQG